MLNDTVASFQTPFQSSDSDERHQGRMSIFIDAAHVFYSASALGIEIDYSQLLPQLAQGGQLLRAYFYSGVDPKNKKQHSFLLWMKRNGYRVITKELSDRDEASSQRSISQRSIDFCVEITTDMIEQAAFSDTVVLVSGDGRFARLLNHFSHLRTRTTLVSLHSMTSDQLLDQADSIVDLAMLKDAIAKRPQNYRRTKFKAA